MEDQPRTKRSAFSNLISRPATSLLIAALGCTTVSSAAAHARVAPIYGPRPAVHRAPPPQQLVLSRSALAKVQTGRASWQPSRLPSSYMDRLVGARVEHFADRVEVTPTEYRRQHFEQGTACT